MAQFFTLLLICASISTVVQADFENKRISGTYTLQARWKGTQSCSDKSRIEADGNEITGIIFNFDGDECSAQKLDLAEKITSDIFLEVKEGNAKCEGIKVAVSLRNSSRTTRTNFLPKELHTSFYRPGDSEDYACVYEADSVTMSQSPSPITKTHAGVSKYIQNKLEVSIDDEPYAVRVLDWLIPVIFAATFWGLMGCIIFTNYYTNSLVSCCC